MSGAHVAGSVDAEISVIVPHYNDLRGLGRCLDRLAAQHRPVGGFEIVVADNDSPCGAAAVAAVIAGRARLVTATEQGAGPARNAGVAAAAGRIFAFTDSDCLPEPGWLMAGVEALGGADFVGGAMRVSVEHDGPLSGAEAFETVFAFDNRRYVEDKGFTVTANLFCSRTVFEATGPFKVGVSEDLEWCQRARRAGYRIGYAPGAVVAHPARADWAGLRKKWARLNAEAFALAASTPGGRLRWVLRSLALPVSILVHTPKILGNTGLRDTGARARAVGTLARLRLWRFGDALRLAMSGKGAT
ncbi:MAG: glycosyltransferase family 2 protein [Sphingomonas sp.]